MLNAVAGMAGIRMLPPAFHRFSLRIASNLAGTAFANGAIGMSYG